MKILLKPLFWLGACVFTLAFLFHALTLMRITLIGNATLSPLFLGVPVMWLPMVLLYRRLHASNGDELRGNLFLTGMPVWVKFTLPSLLVYAVIGVELIAHASALPELSINNLRISGFLMAFYLYCSATFWVASNQPWLLEKKQCPNGHEMLRFAKYCGHCGAQLIDARGDDANH